MLRVEELNPKWVRETLLLILKAVRNLVIQTDKLEEGFSGLKTRMRKSEIDREVNLRQLDKLIDEGERHGTEIASLGGSDDRQEERIVRLEKKAGLAT
jgi:hypothetical protein